MSNQYLNQIKGILEEIQLLGSNYLLNIPSELQDRENVKNLTRFVDVIPNFIKQFNSFEDLLHNKNVSRLIINDLTSILGGFKNTLTNYENIKQIQIVDALNKDARKIHDVLRDLKIMKASSYRFMEMVEPVVAQALSDVRSKVDKIDAALLAIEQHETDKIYLGLSNKYKNEYVRNNFYLIISLIVVVCISLYYSNQLTEISQYTDRIFIVFITFKLLLISVAITLITLFLRRAAHAKKLQDQAYQTHVEISAFPIHVRSLKEEDQHELVKELTMKYFGKELDQTQNDKIGDLMTDQLAAGTELIKASAEILKAKNDSKPANEG